MQQKVDLLFIGTDPGGRIPLYHLFQLINLQGKYICKFLNFELGLDNKLISKKTISAKTRVMIGVSADQAIENRIINFLLENFPNIKIFLFIDENYNVKNRVSNILMKTKEIKGIFYQINTPIKEINDTVVSYFFGSPLLDTEFNMNFKNLFNYEYDALGPIVLVDEFKPEFKFQNCKAHNKFLSTVLEEKKLIDNDLKIRMHPKSNAVFMKQFRQKKINQYKSYDSGIASCFIGYSSFFLALAASFNFPTISLADFSVNSVLLNQFNPIRLKVDKNLPMNIKSAKRLYNNNCKNENFGCCKKIIDVLIKS